MSEERFRWLEAWVTDPADIIRTPGCESNVKEIYDACNELERDPQNVIFNQFCEFGNYLVHYACTGRGVVACRGAAAGAAALAVGRGVRVGDRVGRHARRG